MSKEIKILAVTLAGTFFMLFANAQNHVGDKIYWLALDKYTLALDSGNKSNPTELKDKIIYLQKPDCVDSLPPQINGYNIIQIKSENQEKLYREHGNILIHTKMFPVAVEDSLLHITITPYSGELKGNNRYYLGVSGGTTVYFKYDDKKKQFVVFKVKNWGI